jgi:hypothetical protein
MTPERSIMTSRTAAVAIHVQQYPILEFYAIQFLDVSQTEICITEIFKLVCQMCGVMDWCSN